MNGQIVVRIARMPGNRRLVELQRAPNIPDFGPTQFFECDPSSLPDLNQPDTIRLYGQVLLSKLTSSNEMVRKAVDYALGLGPAASCPIYFNLGGVTDVEQFFWEALCDDKGKFLAWDKRWQVGRIADSPRSVPRNPVPFQAPVKIMAIVSALGVDAIPEWEAFYKAVNDARATGLPLRVFAAIGDEHLADRVSAIVGDNQLTSVTITNQTDLLSQLDKFGPHIVHFFCHGSTAFGQSELQLATFNDAGTNNSSVKLAIDDLLTSAGVRDAWLITLNCCEGGAATKEVHSLTQSLVSQGVYAAVGMMEAVDALDAHEFCKYFYPAIFQKLGEILQGIESGDIETLDWVSALHAPRVAIRDRHQNLNEKLGRQWALPVLYVQPEALRVRQPLPAVPVTFGVAGPTQTSQDEDRGHEETIEGLLAMMPPDKRQGFLQALQEVRARAK
ncbi:MAG: CHAT domain-containing protein [Terracidiphilus sp.]